jgi:hypothetical protein
VRGGIRAKAKFRVLLKGCLSRPAHTARAVVGLSQLTQVLLNACPPCSADGVTMDGLCSSSVSLFHFPRFVACTAPELDAKAVTCGLAR